MPIVVDPYLPCYPWKKPIPSVVHSSQAELWTCMVEKAMAKLNGGYGNIQGGYKTSGLSALTGAPSKQIMHKDADPEMI